MECGESARGALAVSVSLMMLSLAQSQAIEVEVPQELSVCETDGLPTAFTLTCTTSATANSLVWLVTGLNTVGSRTIAKGDTRGPFNYPTPSQDREAALIVNDPANMEVVEGTCFQCRDLISNAISTATCVNVTRTPMAPHSVITTGCAVAWSPSAPGLSHWTRVCLVGTTNCPIDTSCTGCSSTGITGITESDNYTITVCSSSVVNGVPCRNVACAPPIIEELNPTPSPTPTTCTTTGPIGYAPGVIAGVAVGCLSLSLLLTAATGVITFLCTRRCYNKKSSPPSPNEKSVYYETVQSDSVQMQPIPAYQSVEQGK